MQLAPEIAIGLKPSLLLSYVKYGNLDESERNQTKFNKIVEVVTKNTGISYSEMRLSERHRNVVTARHISMYLCKKYTTISLKGIGKLFGGRDHSTVIASLKTVQNLSDTDKSYRELVAKIDKEVK